MATVNNIMLWVCVSWNRSRSQSESRPNDPELWININTKNGLGLRGIPLRMNYGCGGVVDKKPMGIQACGT